MWAGTQGNEQVKQLRAGRQLTRLCSRVVRNTICSLKDRHLGAGQPLVSKSSKVLSQVGEEEHTKRNEERENPHKPQLSPEHHHAQV